MEEKRFHREEYPMDILSEFGLTKDMIYDLPNFVHETIEMGGKSPLLPISIEQPFGLTHGYAKFCLIETEEGVSVLLTPKLKSVNLDAFSENERNLLLEGKVIVADIEENISGEDGMESSQLIKAFVQLDKDTNSVVYSPTQVIGRNLSAISNEYDLTGDDLQSFWSGHLVTVMETNNCGVQEPVTIGVDLFSDKGVIVVPGTADRWEKTVRRTMPEYSFGNDGCWVNRNGQLTYVPENEFTQDIINALTLYAKQNGFDIDGREYIDEQARTHTHAYEEESGRQITR